MSDSKVDNNGFSDKVAGFDPATAPMETDAEAGGVATLGGNLRPASSTSDRSQNGASHGSAIRPFDDTRKAESSVNWMLVFLAGCAVIAAAVFLAMR